MTAKEMDDIFNPKNHVPITDHLINKLFLKGKISKKAAQDMREAKELGLLWNTKRQSICSAPEWTFED